MRKLLFVALLASTAAQAQPYKVESRIIHKMPVEAGVYLVDTETRITQSRTRDVPNGSIKERVRVECGSRLVVVVTAEERPAGQTTRVEGEPSRADEPDFRLWRKVCSY